MIYKATNDNNQTVAEFRVYYTAYGVEAIGRAAHEGYQFGLSDLDTAWYDSEYGIRTARPEHEAHGDGSLQDALRLHVNQLLTSDGAGLSYQLLNEEGLHERI